MRNKLRGLKLPPFIPNPGKERKEPPFIPDPDTTPPPSASVAVPEPSAFEPEEDHERG